MAKSLTIAASAALILLSMQTNALTLSQLKGMMYRQGTFDDYVHHNDSSSIPWTSGPSKHSSVYSRIPALPKDFDFYDEEGETLKANHVGEKVKKVTKIHKINKFKPNTSKLPDISQAPWAKKFEEFVSGQEFDEEGLNEEQIVAYKGRLYKRLMDLTQTPWVNGNARFEDDNEQELASVNNSMGYLFGSRPTIGLGDVSQAPWTKSNKQSAKSALRQLFQDDDYDDDEEEDQDELATSRASLIRTVGRLVDVKSRNHSPKGTDPVLFDEEIFFIGDKLLSDVTFKDTSAPTKPSKVLFDEDNDQEMYTTTYHSLPDLKSRPGKRPSPQALFDEDQEQDVVTDALFPLNKKVSGKDLFPKSHYYARTSLADVLKSSFDDKVGNKSLFDADDEEYFEQKRKTSRLPTGVKPIPGLLSEYEDEYHTFHPSPSSVSAGKPSKQVNLLAEGARGPKFFTRISSGISNPSFRVTSASDDQTDTNDHDYILSEWAVEDEDEYETMFDQASATLSSFGTSRSKWSEESSTIGADNDENWDQKGTNDSLSFNISHWYDDGN